VPVLEPELGTRPGAAARTLTVQRRSHTLLDLSIAM